MVLLISSQFTETATKISLKSVTKTYFGNGHKVSLN